VSWFANPWALWLLTLLPMLGSVALLAWRRKKRRLARLGSIPALRALVPQPGGRGRLRGLCVAAGFVLLIVASAGPQWGRDWERSVASGRDLVVLLDLSRSMLAQDVLPSRVERAKAALLELSYAFQRRGGNRLALVIFAARARVICPLTQDYHHFRVALRKQDPVNLPPELRPRAGGPTSGTRIGAGLRAAVKALQAGSVRPGMILLVSDGDDPAHDEEWRAGARAALARQVPVITVGIGDPRPKFPVHIPLGDDILRHNDAPVETLLVEKPLEEIARLTHGTYVKARTSTLDLGRLFREWIQPASMRSEVNRTIPSYVQRYPWFFGAALVFFTAAMMIGTGVPRPRPEVPRKEEAAEEQAAASPLPPEPVLTTSDP
jgi:Ca-activated chloride channel family protein